jgi:predicted 2-oxoglutarate/Fe(II)-dependent dioxygenase YbiX
MDGAVRVQGHVWNADDGDTVITTVKQRKELLEVPTHLECQVAGHLDEVMSAVSAALGVSLHRLQPLKFCRYDPGDFYAPHRDRTDEPGSPAILRDRKASVIVFLNDQVDEPEDGCYTGGRLTFHGLLDEPPWNRTGHPLDAERGVMLAFPPTVVHEVTPVTWGQRSTITTWFE